MDDFIYICRLITGNIISITSGIILSLLKNQMISFVEFTRARSFLPAYKYIYDDNKITVICIALLCTCAQRLRSLDPKLNKNND